MGTSQRSKITDPGVGLAVEFAVPRPIGLGTFEVARAVGVTWRTLYNWLKRGWLEEPPRDELGERIWPPELVMDAIRLSERQDGRMKRHIQQRRLAR